MNYTQIIAVTVIAGLVIFPAVTDTIIAALLTAKEALERIKKKIQLTETPRRGRWIYQPNDEHLKPYEKVKFYRCSECGRLISVAPFYEIGKSLDEFPYCHCGAKMNGGAE